MSLESSSPANRPLRKRRARQRFLALSPEEQQRHQRQQSRYILTRFTNELLFAKAAAARPDATQSQRRTVAELERQVVAQTVVARMYEAPSDAAFDHWLRQEADAAKATAISPNATDLDRFRAEFLTGLVARNDERERNEGRS